MSEQPGTEWSIPAKLLTVCAVGVLVSLGMCGLATTMRDGWRTAQLFFVIAGTLVLVCSVLAGVISLVIIGIGMFGKDSRK
jgi:hypothetical protein